MKLKYNGNYTEEELDSLYEQQRDREIMAMIERKTSTHQDDERLKPLPKIKPITTKLKQVNS